MDVFKHRLGFPSCDCVQRDETERISGEKTDASDAEGVAKDSISRVPEKEDSVPVGAGEQTKSKVKQEAPPAKVRGCYSVHSKAALRCVRTRYLGCASRPAVSS